MSLMTVISTSTKTSLRLIAESHQWRIITPSWTTLINDPYSCRAVTLSSHFNLGCNLTIPYLFRIHEADCKHLARTYKLHIISP